jgi:O-antigen ligase
MISQGLLQLRFPREKDCSEGRVLFYFSVAMANEFNIPKTHLIMGLALPLAVLLGYFVAEPMGLGSLAVLVFILVVLAIPLMLRWYYPMLVLAWNAAIAPAFLPGRPGLWALLAFGGLLIAVFSRAVSAKARFVIEPMILKPLLALTGVVVASAFLTGGFGLRLLGSGHYGGKHYFYFLAAVAGYFVLTSQRIPLQRAGFYVGLFFLGGLTSVVSIVAGLDWAQFTYLWLLFPPVMSMNPDAFGGPLRGSEAMLRLSELGGAGMAIYAYLLARFGIRGVLDLQRPWLLLLLFLALAGGLLSGFRSFLVLFAILFVVLFFVEGLHRTRLAPALLGLLILGSVVVLPQAHRLPMPVQRTLSFLPGRFDYFAKASATATAEWRVEMWRQLLPEVPKSLFRCRGWNMEARDFYATVEMRDLTDELAGTKFVGNFHNGPLSILLPFGIYGAITFAWFLVAGVRVLHRHWKYGNPELQRVNALLLAAFIARAIFFLGIFGTLQGDMAVFLGLLGLSVALNGASAAAPAPAEAAVPGVELQTEYIKA